MKDLIVLTADGNMKSTFEGLLPRFPKTHPSIRTFDFDVFPHPMRDPGCLKFSHEFLRTYIKDYRYALVVFDHEGSGKEYQYSASELEEKVEFNLSRNGWEDQSAAIVIEPELDIWIWSRSPKLEEAINWKSDFGDLRAWLVGKGFKEEGDKITPPKEALEMALEKTRKPRSSATYRNVSANASYMKCIVPSFLKLISILENWFPPVTILP